MISIIAKIISLLLGMTVIFKTYLDFKKGRENIVMFGFWVVAWSSIMVVSLFPNILFYLIGLVGRNGVGVGTLIGVVFVFLFFVTYRIYVKANRLEQKIRDIVIKIGLDQEENN